jgi:putative ABC transport system ATP-binding protein
MITTSPAPLIEMHQVSKTYQMGDQEVHALAGLDLCIHNGEFVAIMGASGSGKSTLMNILGCLDRPTSGQYLLNGKDVATLRDDEQATVRNRTIGFVFQSFNLLRRTSALKNVELPLVYAGVPAGERAERARAALEQVGLGRRLDHQPSQLSGGQQQRVAVARALVTNPPLILADEPTGNLDSHVSGEVMKLFQGLNEHGLTIVLVTHESEIAGYARRVIHMRDGQVIDDLKRDAGAHASIARQGVPAYVADGLTDVDSSAGPVASRGGAGLAGAAARAVEGNNPASPPDRAPVENPGAPDMTAPEAGVADEGRGV